MVGRGNYNLINNFSIIACGARRARSFATAYMSTGPQHTLRAGIVRVDRELFHQIIVVAHKAIRGCIATLQKIDDRFCFIFFFRECAIKFNDYFEFPREFDMEPYTVAGLAKIEGRLQI